MTTIRAMASAVIPAPAEVVYGIITDYHTGHPRILPPAYFAGLVVERGGVGAGTRIRCQMRSFGRTRTFRADITEPEPGRRLVETLLDSDIVTVFTVDHASGSSSLVAIETRYERTGLRGLVERLLSPPFLRKVYRAELDALAATAREALANSKHSR